MRGVRAELPWATGNRGYVVAVDGGSIAAIICAL